MVKNVLITDCYFYPSPDPSHRGGGFSRDLTHYQTEKVLEIEAWLKEYWEVLRKGVKIFGEDR